MGARPGKCPQETPDPGRGMQSRAADAFHLWSRKAQSRPRWLASSRFCDSGLYKSCRNLLAATICRPRLSGAAASPENAWFSDELLTRGSFGFSRRAGILSRSLRALNASRELIHLLLD